MTKQVTLTCEKCGTKKTIKFPSEPGRYKTMCGNPACREAIIFTVTGTPANQPKPKRIEQCSCCHASVGLPDHYSSPRYQCPKCQAINLVTSAPIAAAPAQAPAPAAAPAPAQPAKRMTPSEAARAAGLLGNELVGTAGSAPFGQGSPLNVAPPEEDTNLDRDLLNRDYNSGSQRAQPANPAAGIQLNVQKKAFTTDELLELRRKGLYNGNIPGNPPAPPQQQMPPTPPVTPQPQANPFGQGAPLSPQPPVPTAVVGNRQVETTYRPQPQGGMGKCELRLQRPGFPEQCWHLREGANLIGRRDHEKPSDIQIDGDSAMSRQSVQIDMTRQGSGYTYRMRVLKKLNPVLHNRRELRVGQEVYLGYNDTIQLGDSMLSFGLIR